MSSVHQARSRRKSIASASPAPAESWPAWTDREVWECSDPADWGHQWDVPITCPPDADEPGPGPVGQTAREWVEHQAVRFAKDREEGRDELAGDYCRLVAGEMRMLAQAMFDAQADHVHQLLARPGTPYRSIDLAAVQAPTLYQFSTGLAIELGNVAGRWIEEGSAVCRLAGAVILRVADDAEFYGSDDAQDYLYDEAAWRAALIDAMCQQVSF